MKSKATTVAAYLASLPPDRRGAIESVRKVILANLDKGMQECMQYGVVGYCVPHSIWPGGHHTRPELPLMYMGLSSQKNDMVVYMLFLHHNQREREWFDAAWKDGGVGTKNHLEVTGAGCCLRFKKVEDLPLDLIVRAMDRMPVKKYLENHAAMLARLGRGAKGGKGAAGKLLKKKRADAGKEKAGTKAKSARPAPKRKAVRKKSVAKRG